MNDLRTLLIREHGHDHTHSVVWPSCAEVHAILAATAQPVNPEVAALADALDSWKPMLERWAKGKGATTRQVAETLVYTLHERSGGA